MKYGKNWIIEQDTVEYLFFWGHQPSRDGSVIKTCLSQWWSSPFLEEGIIYYTAEHYMMAQKAKLFGDKETFQRIITKTSPKDAKDLGRQVKNFDQDVWERNKYQIVKRGNYLKFDQNAALRNFLVKTGAKVLVEASPVDTIWGIGLTEEDARAKNPVEWRGENLLGFALMEVRDMLDQIHSNK